MLVADRLAIAFSYIAQCDSYLLSQYFKKPASQYQAFSSTPKSLLAHGNSPVGASTSGGQLTTSGSEN
jgi:hypothetical protein